MVRFGPLGTSLSLLATAVIAMWAASQGYGLFAGLPPAESALTLQISLIGVAIPLMCLAALIEERGAPKQRWRRRLRFEEMLSRLSGTFVHLSSHDMGEVIQTSLQQLGEFLRLDRLVLVEFSRDGQSWR